MAWAQYALALGTVSAMMRAALPVVSTSEMARAPMSRPLVQTQFQLPVAVVQNGLVG